MAASLLGQKIRKERERLKLTLEELAKKIGSTKSYVWELENKPTARPSADKIFRLADALGVTAEYLMDETQTIEPTPQNRDMAFFRKFQGLDEKQKEFLRKYLDSLE